MVTVRYEIAKQNIELTLAEDLAEQMSERYSPFEGEIGSNSSEAPLYKIDCVEGYLGDEFPTTVPQVTLSDETLVLTNQFGFELKLDLKARCGHARIRRWHTDGKNGAPPMSIQGILRCLVPTLLLYSNSGALFHGVGLKLPSSSGSAKGYLAIGKSGAGKSTTASYFSKDEVLSDELVAMTLNADDCLRIHATPFPGSNQIWPKRSIVDFAAGFILMQAQKNALSPLSTKVLLPYLVSCLALPQGSSHLDQRALEFCTKLAKAHANTPSWHTLALSKPNRTNNGANSDNANNDVSDFVRHAVMHLAPGHHCI